MVVCLLIAPILFISVIIFCGKKKSKETNDVSAINDAAPKPTTKMDPLASGPVPSPPKANESKVRLTKNVPAEERPKTSDEKMSKEPPENCPLAPPPKDKYDDTLRDVNSLQADLSQSVKKKGGGKSKKG